MPISGIFALQGGVDFKDACPNGRNLKNLDIALLLISSYVLLMVGFACYLQVFFHRRLRDFRHRLFHCHRRIHLYPVANGAHEV